MEGRKIKKPKQSYTTEFNELAIKLGYKSPIQFMQNWFSEEEQEKLVA